MTKIILLPAKDYVKDLAQEIRNSHHRVFLVSLTISDDPLTHDVFEAAKQAAQRGVETNIAADAFTFSEFGGYFNIFKHFKARSQAAKKLAQSFKNVGVTFRWLGGGFKFNPFAGVTHLKWSVIDDTVYCFGGANLYQEGIMKVDYMLKLHNPRLANELVQEQQEIIAADMSFRAYDGLHRPFEFGAVYVDSGKRGDSAIYNRACELAAQAISITFVSQYCPTGRLANILKQKQAKVYFNQPQHTPFSIKLMLRFSSFRTGLTSLYQHKTYLHAKFILFEMPDGQKIALTGSHNYSYSGVRFGTREIALETTSKEVYSQLEDFFQKGVA
jgi:cardiolipin synthase